MEKVAEGIVIQKAGFQNAPIMNIRPLKKLGQHFLKDANIARKIVDSLQLPEEALVIEIGPGPGVLTEWLVQKPWQIVAVEVDSRLVERLHNRFGTTDRLRVLNADFLTLNLSELLADFSNRPAGLIGNLPYNLTSPILFKLLEHFLEIQQTVFMVQKEVGERLAASPGSKTYGILSVFCQFYARVEYLFTVPAHLFYPPPKVQSGVIRLTMNPKAEERLADPALFKRVVKLAFQQRRKMLRNSLSQLLPVSKLTKLNLDLSRRPETLSVDEFVELANHIQKIMSQDATWES